MVSGPLRVAFGTADVDRMTAELIHDVTALTADPTGAGGTIRAWSTSQSSPASQASPAGSGPDPDDGDEAEPDADDDGIEAGPAGDHGR